MQPVIQVQNLSKSYAGKAAVKNISFSVGRGEVFGLLGANGAGKSTAVECVLGTKQQDEGSVSILGMNPRTDRKTLFEQVGVQFQESNYPDRITVRELCREHQSLYQSPSDYRELLARLELSDKQKNAVSELSGGQKQRLFIALALIPNPQVVFLDELTTGLDTRARRDVWKYLSGMKSGGRSILLTSHFMDEVEALCDNIMIMKKGDAVFHGTAAEAVERSPYDKFEDAYLWYTEEGSHESL